MKHPVIIGLISDTHGLMRPEAVAALKGSELIIHAGDIGAESVLEELTAVAPVIAVRGNNDTAHWAKTIPTTKHVSIGRIFVSVIHDIKDFVPAQDRTRVVVVGHSHRPSIEERNGVIFVNPGSAGPRRFSLPVSVARIEVHGERITARLIELDVPRSSPPRLSRKGKPTGPASRQFMA